MRRLGFLLVVLALAAGCDDSDPPTGPSTTGPIVFTAQLSAANEVPAITNAESNGRGNVTITFNVPRDSVGAVTGAGTVTFAVQLTGFPAGTPAIAAHIHPGAAGINGAVLLGTTLSATAPIVMGDGTANVTLPAIRDITQAEAQQIVANPAGFYFNVHTPLNPGGAVRGQMVQDAVDKTAVRVRGFAVRGLAGSPTEPIEPAGVEDAATSW